MRPLTVGELLDVSFSAVRRNFATLALCAALVIIPVSILDTFVAASTTEDAFDFTKATTVEEDDFGAYIAGNLTSLVLSMLASVLATAACLRAVGGYIVGQPTSAGESLRFAASRFGPLVWVTILYALAVISGLLLLIVGAIWLGVLFSLSSAALLFEDKRGTKALGRSRDLVKGHWWRTFGAMVVMQIIAAILTAIVVVVIGSVILVDSDNEILNAVVLTAATVLASSITLPLTAALTTYIYFDLRVRKEGFDLQLLAERIGAPAPAAPQSTVAGLPADPPAPEPGGGGFLPPRAGGLDR